VFGKIDSDKKENKRELSLPIIEEFDKEMLFATMFEYNKNGALMCTSWKLAEKGLVKGHA